MTKRIMCLILVYFVFLGFAFSQKAENKIAVYTTGDVETAYKKIIGSKIVSGIAMSEKYIAVERTADFLSALSGAQNQTSGSVSDNQIIKLGQQFEVNYVVIADVSELFGSIFISSRMIDVQNGQIIASTEANKKVDGMDQLVVISNEIVNALLEQLNNKDSEKVELIALGPFDKRIDLYKIENKIPEGYRQITAEELELFVKYGKDLSFPIYVDITKTRLGNVSISYDINSVLYESPTRKNKVFYNFNPTAVIGKLTTPGYVYVVKKN